MTETRLNGEPSPLPAHTHTHMNTPTPGSHFRSAINRKLLEFSLTSKHFCPSLFVSVSPSTTHTTSCSATLGECLQG